MKPVLHAEFLRAFLDGQSVEFKHANDKEFVLFETEGFELFRTSDWSLDVFDMKEYEFRIKPKTININGFEVPEPVRESLEEGQEYWTFDPYDLDAPDLHRWRNKDHEVNALTWGFIFLTQDDCLLFAKALLSFTQSKG